MTGNHTTMAHLLLEDGTYLTGRAIGKPGTTKGEICFNTGMTGYQEVYTDPSYFGQIIISTNAHIGNYGAIEEDQESERATFSGLICKNFSATHSRKTADESLQHFFERKNITGIAEVDTRALVRRIRAKGAMNCIISTELNSKEALEEELSKVPSMAGLELSTKASTAEPYLFGNESAGKRIAVLDLGIKKGILKNFDLREVQCKIFPAKTTYEEMEKWNPDGYFVSNGPGDPAATDYAIETTKAILNSEKPYFGICLGHQILAHSLGLSTYKMFNGHRGLNHPVKNLKSGKSEITTQNHGFAVDKESLKNNKEVELTHVHLNDGSVAGIALKNKPVFSVQYHPEASPGPHDSHYLFDQFINNLN